jgi:hypothetical protein
MRQHCPKAQRDRLSSEKGQESSRRSPLRIRSRYGHHRDMTAIAEMETGDIMAADSSWIGDKEAYAKPSTTSVGV